MILSILGAMIRSHKNKQPAQHLLPSTEELPPDMVQSTYEVIFLGDFRDLPFRTTTTDQITAVVAAGYRTAIMQLACRPASLPAKIHGGIRDLLDRGQLAQLDPDQSFACKLLIVIDPRSLGHKPRRTLRIDAPVSLVLMPHGPATANGRKLYDWPQIADNAKELLPGNVIWAPMTSAVREQLNQQISRPSLSDFDFHACIDSDRWQVRRIGFCASRPVIGRLGAPSADDWPTEAEHLLSLYPDDPQFLVRIANGGHSLRNCMAPFPTNWHVSTLEPEHEQAFLSSIDFFVHSHHPDVVNPVDPYLLKAMATGAVAILPRSLEGMFGHGALYAEPEAVASTVLRMFRDRDRYLDVSRAGVERIKKDFSFPYLRNRIADLIGKPGGDATRRIGAPSTGEGGTDRGRRRVMFITINGVGMGHLTRMLAVAKRCPPTIDPVFVTMSQALKVLREQGYFAEFIPSRQYLDCDINQWNAFLRDELNEMISFYDPAVIMFDGNVPYQGVVDAIKANPDPFSIWSRRGMWRANNKDIIEREKYFDVVLEPGDLAGSDDHGITRHHQERTHHVGPIRLLESGDMLERDEARRELGLDEDKTAVLVQLGAGNNFDYRGIHKTALAHIKDRHDAEIAVGEWLISDQPIDFPDSVVRMPGYPFARYFKAFDFAISAVGYNSFHELLFAGIPTILIPNENMRQDNQLSRALFADRRGLAICVRAHEVYRLTAMIDRLFDPDEREQIKSRLAELDPANGAADAAALIDEMAYSRRVAG